MSCYPPLLDKTKIYIVVSHRLRQLQNGTAQCSLYLYDGLTALNDREAKLFLHLLVVTIHAVFEITETFERLL